MDPVSIANALGGLFQIFGAFGIGQNPREWQQNALMHLLNRSEIGEEMGRFLWGMMAEPLRESALDVTDTLRRPLIDLAPWYLGYGEQQLGGMTDLFRQAGGLYLTPEMEAMAMAQPQLAQQMSPVANIAAQGFAGGGWTPQYQEAFDRFQPYMAGWGSNAQLALGDVGPNLIGQRGQTWLTQGLQDAAWYATQTGGYNPLLSAAAGTAGDILSWQGYTPETAGMVDRGAEFLSREALMTPDQAATFARESAQDVWQQRAEDIYRRAMARGGGPGAVVGAGQQNLLAAEFADQAARAAAENMRQAMFQQQGLMQQEQQLGAELMRQGIASALGREQLGFGMIPDIQQAATQNLQAYLNAGITGGLQAELSRMGLGAEMAQNLLQSQRDFGNLWNQAMASQNQYALGLGDMYNRMLGQQSGMLSTGFGNLLGAGQLGVQRATNLAEAQNRAYQNLMDAYGRVGNVWQTGMGSLGQLGGQAMDFTRTWAQNIAAPFSGIDPNRAPGSQWGAVGSAIGDKK
jgi:hypothetical protein